MPRTTSQDPTDPKSDFSRFCILLVRWLVDFVFEAPPTELQPKAGEYDDREDPGPNVVGGPLDGADIPNGTRDGQEYRWDDRTRRWVFNS